MKSLSQLFPKEVELLTWKSYRLNILKTTQLELMEVLGLRQNLISSLENGQWEAFSSTGEISDLIRQLCIHTGLSIVELFPEILDHNKIPYWEIVNDSFQSSTISSEERISLLQLKDTVNEVLSLLSPLEEKILRLRFAIGEEKDHTLEEVGEKFNITRERARQIEAKAIRALRENPRYHLIKNFFYDSNDSALPKDNNFQKLDDYFKKIK